MSSSSHPSEIDQLEEELRRIEEEQKDMSPELFKALSGRMEWNKIYSDTVMEVLRQKGKSSFTGYKPNQQRDLMIVLAEVRLLQLRNTLTQQELTILSNRVRELTWEQIPVALQVILEYGEYFAEESTLGQQHVYRLEGFGQRILLEWLTQPQEPSSPSSEHVKQKVVHVKQKVQALLKERGLKPESRPTGWTMEDDHKTMKFVVAVPAPAAAQAPSTTEEEDQESDIDQLIYKSALEAGLTLEQSAALYDSIGGANSEMLNSLYSRKKEEPTQRDLEELRAVSELVKGEHEKRQETLRKILSQGEGATFVMKEAEAGIKSLTEEEQKVVCQALTKNSSAPEVLQIIMDESVELLAPVTTNPPCRVVELKNMLSPQYLEEEYQDILEDTRDECSRFGQLVNVVIPKANEVGATKVFLEYTSTADAQKAIDGLMGRTFDGRKVIAEYFDEANYAAKNYADSGKPVVLLDVATQRKLLCYISQKGEKKDTQRQDKDIIRGKRQKALQHIELLMSQGEGVTYELKPAEAGEKPLDENEQQKLVQVLYNPYTPDVAQILIDESVQFMDDDSGKLVFQLDAATQRKLILHAFQVSTIVTDGTQAAAAAAQAQVEAKPRPYRKLVDLIGDASPALLTPFVRTLGNFVTGTDEQTQAVVDAGVIQHMPKLLEHPNKSIRKESCWLLSNLAAGSKAQLEAVLNAPGLLEKVSDMACTDRWEVRKEAIWVVCNMFTTGEEFHVRTLVQRDGFHVLVEALMDARETKMLLVALEATEVVLKLGSQLGLAYAQLFDELNGLDKLEELQEHPSEEVYERSVDMLEKYFGVEDEEAGAPSKAEVGGKKDPPVGTSDGQSPPKDTEEAEAKSGPTTAQTNQQETVRCNHPYCMKVATAGCSACQEVSYCSRECQTADWTNHRPVCQAMQRKKAAESQTLEDLFEVHDRLQATAREATQEKPDPHYLTPSEKADIHKTVLTSVPVYKDESTQHNIQKLPILKALSHEKVPIPDELIQSLTEEYKIGKLIATQAQQKGQYLVLTRKYREKAEAALEECDRQISKQFRKVSLRVHPDRHGDEYIQEFDELCTSYKVLQDVNVRQEYVVKLLQVIQAKVDSQLAHESFIDQFLAGEAEDTAQARYQKATTSHVHKKTEFYLEGSMFEQPPKALHIESKQDRTISIALPTAQFNHPAVIQSISIFAVSESEDKEDRLLKELRGSELLDSVENPSPGFVKTSITLPSYSDYQIYWKATLTVANSNAGIMETIASTFREIDVKDPRATEAHKELPGLMNHAIQLTAALKTESRKLNNSRGKSTASDLEKQKYHLHNVIAESWTISNLLWRCLETIGYSYEEALVYGDKGGGVLKMLLTWNDTCGREKSILDDKLQVQNQKASLKSFQHSVARLIEGGKLAHWILEVQPQELVNTGAEVNRLYQLLIEGKKANRLYVDSAALQNAAARTDLFSTKQCQVLETRATEVAARRLEETQRLLGLKEKEDEEEKERLALEQQASLGIPLRSTVKLHDLVNRADLNGTIGIYMGLAPDLSDRYAIRVQGVDMALKKSNFRPWKSGVIAPIRAQWECDFCTFINQGEDARRSECAVCETPQNEAVPSTQNAPTTGPRAVTPKTAPKSTVGADKGKGKVAPTPTTASKLTVPAKKGPTPARPAPKPAVANCTAKGQPTLNLTWAAKPNIKEAASVPAPKPNAQQLQGTLTNAKPPPAKAPKEAPASSTKTPLPDREITMWIPESEVPAFIGRHGSKITAMREESGAYIRINKLKQNNRGCCAVSVKGNSKQVMAGQMCVERFLQRRQQLKDAKSSPARLQPPTLASYVAPASAVPPTPQPAAKLAAEAPPIPKQQPSSAPELGATPDSQAPADPKQQQLSFALPAPPVKAEPKLESKEAALLRPHTGTPTTAPLSVPDSISIPPASGEDASGVTETMPSPHTMDSLMLFLCQQASTLKCKPEAFYDFLRGEDIESLQDLNEATSDGDFIQEMKAAGLKGFKKAAFKSAVAAAANDASVWGNVPTVDNGLTAIKSSTTQPSQIHLELECPICYDLMVNDPVMASDGYTYERHAIESWFELHKSSPNGIRSPKTNLPMKDLNLVSNKTMLAMARDVATRS